MKNILFPFFALLIALSVFADDGVRVAAWNMRWFPSGYPIAEGKKPDIKREAKRIDSAARFINWQQADVVMVEEMRDRKTCEALVTNEVLKGWKVNACSEFATPTNAVVPTHQNAIISKYDAVFSTFKYWTPKGDICPPRGFVCTVLDINGHLTGFIGLHLKSNYIPDDCEDKELEVKLNRARRELSAQQVSSYATNLLAREFNGRKVEDVFIGGDFNTSIFDTNYVGEATIPIVISNGFADVHASLPKEKRTTMPASKHYPATTFDYLFHKGSSNVNSPTNSPQSFLSDHQMISVVLGGH